MIGTSAAALTAVGVVLAAVTVAVAAGAAAWEVYANNERIAKRVADAMQVRGIYP